MTRVSSSFRDPSGYVYQDRGIFLRKVSSEYQDILMEAAPLLSRLTSEALLLPFEWLNEYTIKPEQLPFVSYPYEWSFSMLKDAALLTLKVAKLSLEYGYQLKDASAYNVQFVKGKPILIDHLSVYPYKEGKPWVAYSQFCRHFLAPLALVSYTRDPSHIKRLALELDGLKLGHASHLLPFTSWLRPGLFAHLKLNGIDGRAVTPRPWMKISRLQLTALLGSLERTISRLSYKPMYGWKDYEKEWNYSDETTSRKAYIVEECLKRTGSKPVLDLGCNVGLYSQVASNQGCSVVAVDSDAACIELLYKSNSKDNILPLIVDVTNPSPAIGWENTERDSFVSRLNVDTIMCLALVHHLAIGNNLPLSRISTFLADNCTYLIIEWVPKEDSQIQKMLRYREDIFTSYTKEGFEEAFSKDFTILDCRPIEGTLRSIYCMEVK